MAERHTDATMAERLRSLEAEVAALRTRLDQEVREPRVTMMCFSGDWDRLYAALSIANGALALGQKVDLFFTFWAVAALRRTGPSKSTRAKAPAQTLLAAMLPRGPGATPLSRMHFAGLGKRMLGGLMRREGVSDLDALLREARELGATLHVCETSLALFGFGPEELEEGELLDRCGAATFLAVAARSRTVLFV